MSAFDTKLSFTVSVLSILSDRLSLASSEYTILPTEPLKEEGISLKRKHMRKDVWDFFFLMQSSHVKANAC